jgi:hypothetical protein
LISWAHFWQHHEPLLVKVISIQKVEIATIFTIHRVSRKQRYYGDQLETRTAIRASFLWRRQSSLEFPRMGRFELPTVDTAEIDPGTNTARLMFGITGPDCGTLTSCVFPIGELSTKTASQVIVPSTCRRQKR